MTYSPHDLCMHYISDLTIGEGEFKMVTSMNTIIIDKTNEKCWEHQIPIKHNRRYVPHSNIEEITFYNKDTDQLVSKFHLIKGVWTLIETNYPEFYL